MGERNTNILSPPFYAFRLEDLRHWHIVQATCARCNRTSIIPHEVLKRGRPGHEHLRDLVRKLRCRQCGITGGHQLTIRPMERD